MRFEKGELVAAAVVWRSTQGARSYSPKPELEVHFFFAPHSPRAAAHNAPTEEDAALDALWRLTGGAEGVELGDEERALCGERWPKWDRELERGTKARVCNACRRRAGLRPKKGREHYALDVLRGGPP